MSHRQKSNSTSSPPPSIHKSTASAQSNSCTSQPNLVDWPEHKLKELLECTVRSGGLGNTTHTKVEIDSDVKQIHSELKIEAEKEINRSEEEADLSFTSTLGHSFPRRLVKSSSQYQPIFHKAAHLLQDNYQQRPQSVPPGSTVPHSIASTVEGGYSSGHLQYPNHPFTSFSRNISGPSSVYSAPGEYSEYGNNVLESSGAVDATIPFGLPNQDVEMFISRNNEIPDLMDKLRRENKIGPGSRETFLPHTNRSSLVDSDSASGISTANIPYIDDGAEDNDSASAAGENSTTDGQSQAARSNSTCSFPVRSTFPSETRRTIAPGTFITDASRISAMEEGKKGELFEDPAILSVQRGNPEYEMLPLSDEGSMPRSELDGLNKSRIGKNRGKDGSYDLTPNYYGPANPLLAGSGGGQIIPPEHYGMIGTMPDFAGHAAYQSRNQRENVEYKRQLPRKKGSTNPQEKLNKRKNRNVVNSMRADEIEGFRGKDEIEDIIAFVEGSPAGGKNRNNIRDTSSSKAAPLKRSSVAKSQMNESSPGLSPPKKSSKDKARKQLSMGEHASIDRAVSETDVVNRDLPANSDQSHDALPQSSIPPKSNSVSGDIRVQKFEVKAGEENAMMGEKEPLSPRSDEGPCQGSRRSASGSEEGRSFSSSSYSVSSSHPSEMEEDAPLPNSEGTSPRERPFDPISDANNNKGNPEDSFTEVTRKKTRKIGRPAQKRSQTPPVRRDQRSSLPPTPVGSSGFNHNSAMHHSVHYGAGGVRRPVGPAMSSGPIHTSNGGYSQHRQRRNSTGDSRINRYGANNNSGNPSRGTAESDSNGQAQEETFPAPSGPKPQSSAELPVDSKSNNSAMTTKTKENASDMPPKEDVAHTSPTQNDDSINAASPQTAAAAGTEKVESPSKPAVPSRPSYSSVAGRKAPLAPSSGHGDQGGEFGTEGGTLNSRAGREGRKTASLHTSRTSSPSNNDRLAAIRNRGVFPVPGPGAAPRASAAATNTVNASSPDLKYLSDNNTGEEKQIWSEDDPPLVAVIPQNLETFNNPAQLSALVSPPLPGVGGASRSWANVVKQQQHGPTSPTGGVPVDTDDPSVVDTSIIAESDSTKTACIAAGSKELSNDVPVLSQDISPKNPITSADSKNPNVPCSAEEPHSKTFSSESAGASGTHQTVTSAASAPTPVTATHSLSGPDPDPNLSNNSLNRGVPDLTKQNSRISAPISSLDESAETLKKADQTPTASAEIVASQTQMEGKVHGAVNSTIISPTNSPARPTAQSTIAETDASKIPSQSTASFTATTHSQTHQGPTQNSTLNSSSEGKGKVSSSYPVAEVEPLILDVSGESDESDDDAPGASFNIPMETTRVEFNDREFFGDSVEDNAQDDQPAVGTHGRGKLRNPMAFSFGDFGVVAAKHSGRSKQNSESVGADAKSETLSSDADGPVCRRAGGGSEYDRPDVSQMSPAVGENSTTTVPSHPSKTLRTSEAAKPSLVVDSTKSGSLTGTSGSTGTRPGKSSPKDLQKLLQQLDESAKKSRGLAAPIEEEDEEIRSMARNMEMMWKRFTEGDKPIRYEEEFPEAEKE